MIAAETHTNASYRKPNVVEISQKTYCVKLMFWKIIEDSIKKKLVLGECESLPSAFKEKTNILDTKRNKSSIRRWE